jgi:hypothetical protein
VDLPAAEIGGRWFHGLGVGGYTNMRVMPHLKRR